MHLWLAVGEVAVLFKQMNRSTSGLLNLDDKSECKVNIKSLTLKWLRLKKAA